MLGFLGAMLGGGAVVALVVWSVFQGEARAEATLQTWLRDNNYELLQKAAPWIKDNPFLWSSNRGQKVFYVTIRQPDGQLRRAWIRCGHALWGAFVDGIEVKWDNRPIPPIKESQDPRDQVLPAP